MGSYEGNVLVHIFRICWDGLINVYLLLSSSHDNLMVHKPTFIHV